MIAWLGCIKEYIQTNEGDVTVMNKLMVSRRSVIHNPNPFCK